ncbi:MAG: sugar ABC transporter ATP-binding protein [Thermotogae bacterium]|nr:sugar ABC transporter ATP-binding protein [Thermotogota bacterium]
MPKPLVVAENISKSFPGVQALKKVNFSCSEGTIHGLVGENGAGKSTLIKVISGLYRPDEGRILYKGQEVSFSSPRDAIKNGIRVVYQEFGLVPFLSIAENVFLGSFPGKGPFHSKKKMYERTKELMKMLDFHKDPDVLVTDLSVGEQQFVEIMKSLVQKSRLLILDEPTAALLPNEVEKLFKVMKNLKSRGVAIVFVSHRLPEILEICDIVTVMKDGEVVGTYEANALTEEEIVNLMVGRKLDFAFPERPKRLTEGREVILEVNEFTPVSTAKPVSFQLFKGEILGLYGLEGQGQRSVMRALFGLEHASGEVKIHSNPVKIKNPGDAIINGLIYTPADRKEEGLALILSVYENIAMPALNRARKKVINDKELKGICENIIKEFNIRTAGTYQKVLNLSGGNQQKVVIGKWFSELPRVIILDEPTRGIDVGSKMEIYKILRDLANRGVGIILFSSDLIEMIGICDRILTFYEGEITGEIEWQEFSEKSIMTFATGTHNKLSA